MTDDKKGSLNDLIDAIRSRSALINHELNDNRVDLGELFMKSIRKTMKEIRHGANSDDFSELVVVNLIIMGSNEGYSAEEMKDFVMDLKSTDDYDDHL